MANGGAYVVVVHTFITCNKYFNCLYMCIRIHVFISKIVKKSLEEFLKELIVYNVCVSRGNIRFSSGYENHYRICNILRKSNYYS